MRLAIIAAAAESSTMYLVALNNNKNIVSSIQTDWQYKWTELEVPCLSGTNTEAPLLIAQQLTAVSQPFLRKHVPIKREAEQHKTTKWL